MAHHVAVQAGRLLTSEHAERLAEEARGWWDAQRAAYPSRADVSITCDCGARVRVDLVDEMRCRACEQWGVWQWWSERGLVVPEEGTAQDVMDWLLTQHGMLVNYGTLRSWRSRFPSIAAGRDGRSRALYIRQEVFALAQRMGGYEVVTEQVAIA
jgi:hypothetical protein